MSDTRKKITRDDLGLGQRVSCTRFNHAVKGFVTHVTLKEQDEIHMYDTRSASVFGLNLATDPVIVEEGVVDPMEMMCTILNLLDALKTGLDSVAATLETMNQTVHSIDSNTPALAHRHY